LRHRAAEHGRDAIMQVRRLGRVIRYFKSNDLVFDTPQFGRINEN